MGTRVRPASIHDVPAAARLILAALSEESPWKAFFSPKAQSNSELVEKSEELLRSCLEPGPDKNWLVLVLELERSDIDRSRPSAPLIVSVAVWDLSAVGGWSHCHQSQAQEELHDDILHQAYLDGRGVRLGQHGPCIHLHVLATRPAYQRRGYGKALMSWGVDLAREKQAFIGVQSSSRAYILFSGLGFADLGPVLLPTETGGDELVIKAMRLDIPRHAMGVISLWRSLMRFLLP
ncbi:hypothetical protein DCS_04018 [Drechmeria coniospora]|uniref:N-acetyltransferase domain-containing protein n=1 Tax=Drechmeria coniospora TaxID=98403 RepID=A0A151GIY6_DRECN|nr:hypothetical protein DCS_04018 [Drechmeria coniospora]KYK57011.1 hypothetical protein DCS_04018 [Drechmeria coniospora]